MVFILLLTDDLPEVIIVEARQIHHSLPSMHLRLNHDLPHRAGWIPQVELCGGLWSKSAEVIRDPLDVISGYAIVVVSHHLIPDMNLRFCVSTWSNVGNKHVIAERLQPITVLHTGLARRRPEVGMRIFQSIEKPGNDSEGLPKGGSILNLLVVFMEA